MHQPVLLKEALDALNIDPNGIYIDGTFGRGGHAQAILERLTTGRLLVIDKDKEAILHAQQRFASDQRVIVCHGSFAEMDNFAKQHELMEKVNGVLLDLGVSSPQLDTAERGFSFLRDGPLDMRMDVSQGISASSWLAEVDEKTLADVLYQFGEERFSRRIAKAIIVAQNIAPIIRTQQLADVIAKAHPRWEKHKHPATRSFQAIRIYLNGELDDLQHGLQASLPTLAPGGRLAVISFHSLEDRIAKHFIKQQTQGDELPRGLPIREEELIRTRKFKAVGRAIKPSADEVDHNVRARSATLRVMEKII